MFSRSSPCGISLYTRGMHRKACLSFVIPTGTTNGFSCSAGLAKLLMEMLRTLTI
nr:MAG TPA: hypothetical protein [Caudoviricetes sp.]